MVLCPSRFADALFIIPVGYVHRIRDGLQMPALLAVMTALFPLDEADATAFL